MDKERITGRIWRIVDNGDGDIRVCEYDYKEKSGTAVQYYGNWLTSDIKSRIISDAAKAVGITIYEAEEKMLKGEIIDQP